MSDERGHGSHGLSAEGPEDKVKRPSSFQIEEKFLYIWYFPSFGVDFRNLEERCLKDV